MNLHTFRRAGLLEGASLLVLVLVAMPLKYLADRPMAVRVVGMAHGVLFLAYCALLLAQWRAQGWPVRRVALLFAAAWIPGGTLYTDRWLRQQERADA